MNALLGQAVLDPDEASEAGRRLVAQRRVVTRNCDVCGIAIVGPVSKRYCGGKCAKRGQRASKKQRQAKVSRFLRKS